MSKTTIVVGLALLLTSFLVDTHFTVQVSLVLSVIIFIALYNSKRES